MISPLVHLYLSYHALRNLTLSGCLRAWCRCMVLPVCVGNAIALSISLSSSVGSMYRLSIIYWADFVVPWPAFGVGQSGSGSYGPSISGSLGTVFTNPSLFKTSIKFTGSSMSIVLGAICLISVAAMGGSYISAWIILLWLSRRSDLGQLTSSLRKFTWVSPSSIPWDTDPPFVAILIIWLASQTCQSWKDPLGCGIVLLCGQLLGIGWDWRC